MDREQIKKECAHNMKIHYLWSFVWSFLFLTPVLSIFYQFYWLDISKIVILSSLFSFFVTILEIPTSTLWDSIGRTKTLKLSILSSFISYLIYFFFPSPNMFYIAVFFSALWQALWSGTGHAKLQEDLEGINQEKKFWIVIGRLIALSEIGKIITPIAIYFILKYSENPYHLLAGLDLIVWFFAIIFVFQFKKWADEETHFDGIWHFFEEQKTILKKWATFFFHSKTLLMLLFLMILWNNLGYLDKVFLPYITKEWLKDFLSSYVLWGAVVSWIAWNILIKKISNKIAWEKLFISLIWISSILHLLSFFFAWNLSLLIPLFFIISFFTGLYLPTWNHLLMSASNTKEKATTRSFFLLCLGAFKSLFLYISNFFAFQFVLLFISILSFFGFIFWSIYYGKRKK